MPTDNLAKISTAESNPAVLYLLNLTTLVSRNTQRYALNHFVRFMEPGTNLQTFPWQLLRAEHLLVYRDSLIARLKPKTVNRMITALRGVAKMAWLSGLIGAENYARIREVKKIRDKSPRVGRDLANAHIQAMLGCAKRNRYKWHRVRDVAILTLLYASGMRRAELVRLDLADVVSDGTRASIRAHGKGHKLRVIYVSMSFLKPLDAWLKVRGQEPGPLFTHHHTMRRVSGPSLACMVRRLAREAQLGRVTPHDFRRTFAGRLLDAGADLPSVSALMGHECVSTTALYDLRGDRAIMAAADKLPGFG